MFDTSKLLFMKYLFFLFILFTTSFCTQAQEQQGATKFSISPAFELMRSTHANLFYAPSVKANFLYKNGFEPGFGIERSSTPLHHDNGYVLYKLRYLPIYGNLKYNLKSTKKLKPYAESSVGYSFIKYDIADDLTPTVTSAVKEGGLYIYGGFGMKYAISTKINSFVGIGFKAYRITTNDLDINPHGLSFQAGFSFL